MTSISVRPSGRRLRPLPWIVALAIIGAVAWRMIYLHSINDAFSAGFFLGAFLGSVQLGSLYALIALGYTMVYGIIRLINFAHGEVFMMGAFGAYFLFSRTPYPPLASLLIAAAASLGFMYLVSLARRGLADPLVLTAGGLAFAVTAYSLNGFRFSWIAAMVASMLITGVLGVMIDRIAYRPLRGAPRNSMLITAIAVSFFLQNVGLLAFTRNQTPFRPQTMWTGLLQFEVAGTTVFTTWMILLVPLLTVALVTLLHLFVTRTRLGWAMRATSQDAETAQMMGVDVNRVIAITFFVGALLAGAAAVLWGMTYGSINQPAIFGVLPGIKAFAAAVIGGIGSLPGAVVGGLLLGFLENFLTALFPRTSDFAGITEYKDTFAFLALILILLFRPSGIVGEDLSEKV